MRASQISGLIVHFYSTYMQLVLYSPPWTVDIGNLNLSRMFQWAASVRRYKTEVYTRTISTKKRRMYSDVRKEKVAMKVVSVQFTQSSFQSSNFP